MHSYCDKFTYIFNIIFIKCPAIIAKTHVIKHKNSHKLFSDKIVAYQICAQSLLKKLKQKNIIIIFT